MEQWSGWASFPPRAAGELLWGPAVLRSPNSFSGSQDLKQVSNPHTGPHLRSLFIHPSIHSSDHPSIYSSVQSTYSTIHPSSHIICLPTCTCMSSSIHPFTHLLVHHPIHPSTCPHIHTHLSICLFIRLPTHCPSTHLSIPPPTYSSVQLASHVPAHLYIFASSYLPIHQLIYHLFIHPPVHSSIHSSTHLSTYLSTHPSMRCSLSGLYMPEPEAGCWRHSREQSRHIPVPMKLTAQQGEAAGPQVNRFIYK